PPIQDGLAIQNWNNKEHPSLNGKLLEVEEHEGSRSLAISPDKRRFVLGTNWALRSYDDTGKLLWRRDAPAAVWAVNISGDGRLLVAAYGDGTIRWHRLDDGQEVLAFMPLANRVDWVAWTPEGFYGATDGARDVLNWQVNQGWDAAAKVFPVSS